MAERKDVHALSAEELAADGLEIVRLVGPEDATLGVVPSHPGLTAAKLDEVLTEVPAKAVEMDTMNVFATLLGYGLALLPSIVTGIQTEVGDSLSGATKEQMANDALAAALQGAAVVLPAGSANASLAAGSGALASEVIDATSSIATVLSHLGKTKAVKAAVNLTKATGAYQAATKTAAATASALAAAPEPVNVAA